MFFCYATSMHSKTFILFVRNFIFGAEDSLVSTVGLLAGVASAGIPRKDIIISGVVLIFVEAFSMGVGSFLSERTTEESQIDNQEKFSNSLIALCNNVFLIFYLWFNPCFHI